MPIRFPCDHCGGVLSIARRKAYALVDCPKCGCKQVVPNESRADLDEFLSKVNARQIDESSAMAVAVAEPPKVTMAIVESHKVKEVPLRERPLFERDDIENLLANDAKKINSIHTATLIPAPSTQAEIATVVEIIAETNDVLRKNQLVLVICLSILAALLVFGLGFLTGKYS